MTEHRDDEWDRNAERLTREAGLGDGRINPKATSVDNLFLESDTSAAWNALNEIGRTYDWLEGDGSGDLAQAIQSIAAQFDEKLKAQQNLKSISNQLDGVTVSAGVYWRYDPPPLSTKIFLLNEGGVAITPGVWVEGAGLIAWHPLFKRNKAEEARLGIK
jgi:hypothetical protein